MKKYFIRIIILQSLFLILVSCFTTKQLINLKSTFNENQAKELLKEGNNTIKGAALMRQKE